MDETKTKQTMLRLNEEEREYLKELGKGNLTEGARRLIENEKKRLESAEQTIEDKFYDFLILPNQKNLREIYQVILESFLKNDISKASPVFLFSLAKDCGLDEKTASQIFKKLDGKYIKKKDNYNISPVIRLKPAIDIKTFKEVLAEFVDFLQESGEYAEKTISLNDIKSEEVKNE